MTTRGEKLRKLTKEELLQLMNDSEKIYQEYKKLQKKASRLMSW